MAKFKLALGTAILSPFIEATSNVERRNEILQTTIKPFEKTTEQPGWSFLSRSHAAFVTPYPRYRAERNRGLTTPNTIQSQVLWLKASPKEIPFSSNQLFQQPIPNSAIALIPDKIEWIMRNDAIYLLKHAFGVSDNNPPSPHLAATNIQLSSGTQLDLTSEESSALLSVLGEFYQQKFNLTENQFLDQDHALLLVQPNVTEVELKQVIREMSGELGVKTFEKATINEPLNLPNPQAAILSLRHWQIQYVSQALKLIDISHCLEETLKSSPLEDELCFESALKVVNKKITQLTREGVIRNQPSFSTDQLQPSWLTPTLNRLIYNNLFSQISRLRYEQNIVMNEPTMSAKKQGPNLDSLTQLLKRPDMSTLSHQVASALEAGYIKVNILDDEEFRDLCLDLSGFDRSRINGAFMRGAEIFVHQPNGLQHPDLAPGEINIENIPLIGFILHEAVHVLDWLEDPAAFERYRNYDMHEIVRLEKRAYREQRQLHRLFDTPFAHDSPDPNIISNDDYLMAVILDHYRKN